MRRRTLLRSAAGTATMGVAGVAGMDGTRGGQETTTDGEGTATDGTATDETATDETTTAEADRFALSSAAFESGEEIPTEYTCDGANRSPPLRIESPPEETQSFALVMDDPDAPSPPFVHWLLWDVPADAREIPEGVPTGESVEPLDGAVQGANGTGDLGYVGPCPPEDDPRHTYLFELYALDEPLGLDPGAEYEAVLGAVFPRALARARLVGQYERADG